MAKVENITSSKGNKIANQFILLMKLEINIFNLIVQ